MPRTTTARAGTARPTISPSRYAGFILIAGFPLFILFASLVLWRLEKRKDARKAADKARALRADARGGW